MFPEVDLSIERRLVYVSGPFAGKDKGEIRGNVWKAGQLSLIAIKAGYIPISYHSLIHGGYLGRDDVLEERERGIKAMEDICRHVARVGGSIWVILRDDRTMSPGTQREFDAFSSAASRVVDPKFWCRMNTWAAWSQFMKKELE